MKAVSERGMAPKSFQEKDKSHFLPGGISVEVQARMRQTVSRSSSQISNFPWRYAIIETSKYFPYLHWTPMTKCVINQTSSYVETIQFRSLDALPGQYEVVIQSQLLHAKDPSALQVKYQTIASASALRELRDTLNKLEGI